MTKLTFVLLSFILRVAAEASAVLEMSGDAGKIIWSELDHPVDGGADDQCGDDDEGQLPVWRLLHDATARCLVRFTASDSFQVAHGLLFDWQSFAGNLARAIACTLGLLGCASVQKGAHHVKRAARTVLERSRWHGVAGHERAHPPKCL